MRAVRRASTGRPPLPAAIFGLKAGERVPPSRPTNAYKKDTRPNEVRKEQPKVVVANVAVLQRRRQSRVGEMRTALILRGHCLIPLSRFLNSTAI